MQLTRREGGQVGVNKKTEMTPILSKNSTWCSSKTLLPVPNLTPRHYHIIVQREKGSLFIYTIVIARILLLIAVLDSLLWYRMSLR